MAKFNETFFYHQPKHLNEISAAAHQVVSENETIFIGLKGAFKEYLICTENNLYIADCKIKLDN